MTIIPIILCGGSGSRLWPLSRKSAPKQFHKLVGDKTMLTSTVERVGVQSNQELYQAARIIGSAAFDSIIIEQCNFNNSDIDRFIFEPVIRDTCAAIAAAICDIAEKDPDRIVLILPSDHYVADHVGFNMVVRRASDAVASDGGIMTIGITPTRPETQYGYIERAHGDGPIYAVERFREKPDLAAAQAYISVGTFFWNAGIFMFKAGEMAEEFKRQEPQIWENSELAVSKAIHKGRSVYLDEASFSACKKISIDYGIMENARKMQTIQATFDWSDLGSWNQLHETEVKDNKGNVIIGDAVTTGVYNSYIRSEDRTVAVAGIDDIVIISQPDALMIVNREKSFLVKDLYNEIAKKSWPPKHISTSGKRIPDHSELNDWIFDHAFPFWALKGIDYQYGGVHEALDYSGKPVDLGKKRLRVLARQIYCFSEASIMGWDGDCKKILNHCTDTLINTGWHKDGGFIHLYNLDGSVQDDTRDFYDQCFVLLGFASLWKALKDPRAKKWGEMTLDFVDAEFADQENGGFYETPDKSGQRRANPHMHFFEAMLAWYEATGEQTYLDRATTMVSLFKDKFFDRENWRLHEIFEADWTPASNDINKVEPGHHYEWVWLLLKYVSLSGDDSVKDYARKLYATALSFGHYPQTDAVALQMHFDGSELSTSARMWAQTEGLKAAVAMKEHGMTVDGNLAIRMLDQIYNRYLLTPVKGGWFDATDSDGRVVSTNMPSSTFYHVLCAFSEYLRVEGQKS